MSSVQEVQEVFNNASTIERNIHGSWSQAGPTFVL